MKFLSSKKKYLVLVVSVLMIILLICAIFRSKNSFENSAETIDVDNPIDVKNQIRVDKNINRDINTIELGAIGDEVNLGKYELREDGKKENIEWIIIDKKPKEGKALLLSKRGLSYQSFKGENIYNIEDNGDFSDIDLADDPDITWDVSPVREWMNDIFYNTAFTDKEKSYIIDSELKTIIDVEKGIRVNTTDKLFLLAIDDIKEYFKSKNKRLCVATKLADKINDSDKKKKYGIGSWWLRDHSKNKTSNNIIDVNGNITNSRHYKINLVRPAMWVYYKNKSERKYTGANAVKLGKVGSQVYLGKYYIKNNHKKEEILWDVKFKDKKKKEALLVSHDILDVLPYNDEYEKSYWAISYARAWLNQYFYDEAFSMSDKKKIVKKNIDNRNFFNSSGGGKNTSDSVFILSREEMIRYFDDDLYAAGTDYVVDKGFPNVDYVDIKGDTHRASLYLLRTMCADQVFPMIVNHYNKIDDDCSKRTMYESGVRPAIWVRYEDTKRDTTKAYSINAKDVVPVLFDKNANKWDKLPISDSFIKKENEVLSKKYGFKNNDQNFYEFEYYEDEDRFAVTQKCKNKKEDKNSNGIINTEKNVVKTIFECKYDHNGFLDDIKVVQDVIDHKEINTGATGSYKEPPRREDNIIPLDNKNIKYDPRYDTYDVNKEKREKAIDRLKDAEIGDEVIMGKYSCKNKKPMEIKWTVLDKNDEGAYLVSSQVIDAIAYETDENRWELSNIRKWLNEIFYPSAFKIEERNKIMEVEYLTYGYKDGPEKTNDKITLLSKEELRKYFNEKNARLCISTSDAMEKVKGEDHKYWWLRDPYAMYSGVRVSDTGVVDGSSGERKAGIGIRPAMWVKY